MKDKKNNKEEKAASPVPDYPPEIMCPSCNKFVGAYEICPHCQASVPKRISLIIARRLSVIGAIVGLIMLYAASVYYEPQLVTVGEMGVGHNMALVRVIGTVDQFRIMKDRDAFTMRLDDGTGKISLGGWGKLTKFESYYKSTGSDFPRIGDKIEVVGQLAISEKYGISMFLGNPRRINILERFVPQRKTVAQLKESDKGTIAEIQASIESVRAFKSGRNIMIYDETGSLSLTLFDSELANIPDGPGKDSIIAEGRTLLLRVRTDEYRGNTQLRLNNPGSPDTVKLVSIDSAPPPPKAETSYSNKSSSSYKSSSYSSPKTSKRTPAPLKLSSEVYTSEIGDRIQVRGVLESVTDSEDGTIIEIKDSEGIAKAWISKKVKKYIDAAALIKGVKLAVSGQVSEYQKSRQLTVRFSGDVVVTGVTATSAGTKLSPPKLNAEGIPEIMSINQALRMTVGTSVSVIGTISEKRDFRSGVRMTILDDSGASTLWVPSMVSKHIKPELLELGNKIKVTADVAEHFGKSQLELKHSSRLTLE